jgi:hypothetical protein
MEDEMEYLEEIFVGTVIEYDDKAHEAVVKLSHELCVGDHIRIKGKSHWEQILERMFINGKPAAKVFPGDIVRIGLLHHPGKNDSLFLLLRIVSLTGPSKTPGEPVQEEQPTEKPPEIKPPQNESSSGESPPQEHQIPPDTDSPLFDIPDLPGTENYPDSQGGKGSHYKPKGHGSGG